MNSSETKPVVEPVEAEPRRKMMPQNSRKQRLRVYFKRGERIHVIRFYADTHKLKRLELGILLHRFKMSGILWKLVPGVHPLGFYPVNNIAFDWFYLSKAMVSPGNFPRVINVSDDLDVELRLGHHRVAKKWDVYLCMNDIYFSDFVNVPFRFCRASSNYDDLVGHYEGRVVQVMSGMNVVVGENYVDIIVTWSIHDLLGVSAGVNSAETARNLELGAELKHDDLAFADIWWQILNRYRRIRPYGVCGNVELDEAWEKMRLPWISYKTDKGSFACLPADLIRVIISFCMPVCNR